MPLGSLASIMFKALTSKWLFILMKNKLVSLITLLLLLCFRTWTLDDDECLGLVGVAANWTPIFNIYLGMPADLGNGFFFNERFQVLLKINGVGMWLSCNVDNREAEIIQLYADFANGPPSYFHMYTETLVSLPGLVMSPTTRMLGDGNGGNVVGGSCFTLGSIGRMTPSEKSSSAEDD
ncbi:hypothetical protein POM88_053914 [Heracleum sosnowskyi]|uniref:Uncharacterized protein n=1 Tax=Heracleum sosnowskyi TaxID=360622 RepID=A0AAD8GP58_9APIA|nr:hypothetical protein POM88_053914 [Heracleum sosnowskyi]